ncbi:GntR family transcriptional regulator [Leisingera caerulea]|uniref:GntR family transcriptional regulator n=1 Tax=Leisingera caerulea TaxID=506591 RepID=A0A9Q9HQ78_LEICA|nr:GntR family transcriptional regulator [Leisingera caerulea]UWQ56290.1 GntR family transcriptional regulator [Leisingera caerulea]
MKDASKNRKAALYSRLKTAIMTLELRPGADLDEAKLSEESGLSRTPLREVLRQLAGEGYVDLRENRGARVSEMSHMTLRDFFLAAPMIYGAVMQLAAKHATPAQIADLKAAQEDFKAALRTGSSADRAMANNRFHEITGEMADNIYLLPSFQRLLIDHARIGMTFYRPQDARMAENLDEASAQHDAIIAAIEAGDAAAAGQLAIDHWNLSRDQIELFVMPAGLDLPLGTVARKTPA